MNDGGGFRRTTQPGKRVRQVGLLVIIAVIALMLVVAAWPSAASADRCGDRWVGKVVSAEGGVQARRAGEDLWRDVAPNELFCAGDIVRVQENSRAALVLSNDAVIRLDQNTTISFNTTEKESSALVELIEGAAHFFSRTPRSLKVLTPFVNAAVEGTEFFMRVESGQTFISIFNGQITATNEAGSVTLTNGQAALAKAGQAPVLHSVVRPRDAVQWALYYPPILDENPALLTATDAAAPDSYLEALGHYRAGRIQAAFRSLQGVPENRLEAFHLTFRAQLYLAVGRVEQANADLQRVIQENAGNSRAVALQAIMAVVQNDKERARLLAKRAVELDSRSTAGLMALSYVQQADFDLKGAIASIEQAVQVDSRNALAQARLSELWLSQGYLNKALMAAKQSVELNPRLGRPQTVLGYAYLTQVRTRESREAFEEAIARDPSDPLARLGLGLARIRDGNLKEGRREIEIAADLDPNNSLIRSYMGKAYQEEKRGKLAATQFDLAKELDPQDPTPWFYDALRKQSENRPVEALDDLEKAIQLNDNRAVYRSRLLLDQDLAARSASLARIYRNLGFDDLSLLEGWKSLNADPSNYSAHRFLADSYSALPRHEIARVSELLQSQLLQPININPVQPHSAESKLFFTSGFGPSDPSFNEYTPMFNRNRLSLLTSGVFGERGILGNEAVLSGVYDRTSFSFGQFHYQNDGDRPNNDQNRNIYNVFTQWALTPQASMLVEYRHSNYQTGDLYWLFDPDAYSRRYRETDATDSVRWGYHYALTPASHLLVTTSYQRSDSDYAGGNPREETHGYGVEGQHIYLAEYFNLITGVGHFGQDIDDLFPDYGFSEHYPVAHTNIYAYSQIHYPSQVVWTLGLSADFFDGDIFKMDRTQINPKFGVTWTPFPGTTLRAAAFRAFKRTLLSNQTLEPTQVAGFNQFFDDPTGTDAWRYGVGIDQRIAQHLYAGLELSRRDLTSWGYRFDGTVIQGDLEEEQIRAYLSWAPHPWVALGPEYLYERFRRPQDLMGAEAITHLDTHRLSFGFNFFHPSGFLAYLKPGYVIQSGRFQALVFSAEGPAFTDNPGDDQFLVVDAAIGYRLPNQWGVLTLEAKNLCDNRFNFQDTDVFNPSIAPRRTVVFKFTLSF
jgi:tetratricopeptide (TPR) repeat protein